MSLLVREEIELAKAEVETKLKKLATGRAVGAAAGIFIVVALVFLLHVAAWWLGRALRHTRGSATSSRPCSSSSLGALAGLLA